MNTGGRLGCSFFFLGGDNTNNGGSGQGSWMIQATGQEGMGLKEEERWFPVTLLLDRFLFRGEIGWESQREAALECKGEWRMRCVSRWGDMGGKEIHHPCSSLQPARKKGNSMHSKRAYSGEKVVDLRKKLQQKGNRILNCHANND